MSKINFSKKTIAGIIIGLLILVIIIFLMIRGCTNKMYTITFDANGGSTIEPIKVSKNEKIDMPADPSKSGYEFVGWYYDDKLFDFDTKITKDITLKAHWTKSGVELSSSSLNLLVGSSEKIEFSILPNELREEDFVFSSSDKNIVEVDEKGNIKAIKSGTAIITIKSKDGKYETTCKVTVTEKNIEIDSVTINGDGSLMVGSSIKLSVKYSPEDATSSKLKWESSNNSIATIDENGVVRGLKVGVVTITVTTENGKTATKRITVKEVTTSNNSSNNSNNKMPNTSGGNTGSTTPSKPSEVLPSSVSISGNSEVYLNETIKLIANVSPSNATNKNVTWSITNNTGSASIDQSGTVRGTKVGTVTVTVRTSNGITSSKQITVKEREAKYDLYLTPITMGGTGGSTQYNYEVKKNGITFTDYIGFYFVDRYIGPGSGTIDADTVNKNGTSSVTLTLKDNKTVTMTVHING